MFGVIVSVGKVVLMSLGGMAVVGSVMSLAQRRGKDTIDLDEYDWKNEDDEYVPWDALSLEEQSVTLKGLRDGSIEL